MASITKAVAIANNEVAYLGWKLDEFDLPGLLGFHIVRQHLDAADAVVEERPLASYVAFKGQSNPNWQPQNTTVWPVQKFTWRDLTLRNRRDALDRRPADQRLRYRIAAVGRRTGDMRPVDVIAEPGSSYVGKPIPLGYLTEPALTNVVTASADHAPFTSTFTNGILSTQFLLHLLGAAPHAGADATLKPGLLESKLKKPGDPLRAYLSGDVLPLIRDFFATDGGRFHAALYELDDKELLELLKQNSARIDLILSDAGSGKDANGVVTYDTRNTPARAALARLARAKNSTFTLQNRMFNGSGHIGHNKFVVHVDANGKADAVLTGSTNWTWSGVAGQSNNCTRIDDPDIAATYLDYWNRLHDDAQPTPTPLGARSAQADQSDTLKKEDRTPVTAPLSGGSTIEVWFSPNMPGKAQPPARSVNATPPPDMARLFSLMRKARRAIFFLVFLPSAGGAHSIVSEAVDIGTKDPSLDVIGAISDSVAMWGATTAHKDASGKKVPAWSPHVFRSTAGNVAVVRATALTDKEIGRPLGDFELGERLAAEKAIIHDKILVIDPLDPEACVVAFGSHNLGYKASYSNDENLIIVQGHRGLAEAYATHVLDVYDHYRFRAALAETAAATRKPGASKTAPKPWDGFLSTRATWQDHSSHRLANYLLSRAPG